MPNETAIRLSLQNLLQAMNHATYPLLDGRSYILGNIAKLSTTGKRVRTKKPQQHTTSCKDGRITLCYTYQFSQRPH